MADKNGYIETNMGTIPIVDYLEIRAIQCGFDSYEELRKEGYHIDIPEECCIKKKEN